MKKVLIAVVALCGLSVSNVNASPIDRIPLYQNSKDKYELLYESSGYGEYFNNSGVWNQRQKTIYFNLLSVYPDSYAAKHHLVNCQTGEISLMNESIFTQVLILKLSDNKRSLHHNDLDFLGHYPDSINYQDDLDRSSISADKFLMLD